MASQHKENICYNKDYCMSTEYFYKYVIYKNLETHQLRKLNY